MIKVSSSTILDNSLKPNFLQKGDTIAVIAPASAPRDESVYHAGIDVLRNMGYTLEVAQETFAPYGYLAAHDAKRLEVLNHYLNRSDVKVLWCARGGYGATRILDELDYEAAKKHPKLLVGYSDITALHLALYEKAGWIGLSGPLVVEFPEMDDITTSVLFDFLTGKNPTEIMSPTQKLLKPYKTGTGKGTLLGGNMTLVTQLIGTPYLPDLTGAILFLEEVGEVPYRVDRMFSQLKLSGILDKLGGLVLGGFTEAETSKPSLSLEEVLSDYTQNMPYPIATNLTYGHFPLKSTIPVGVEAQLIVSETDAKLTLLESITQ